MPLITVIIPVYNAEVFLRETIDSVLWQTLADFELLLLDDGSTDRSREIILSYTDSRIKYIPCPHDFTGTLNAGFSLARGQYIAQLDHDDIMMPHRLQIQYEFMESHPDIVACGGWMHSFGKNSHPIRIPLQHDELALSILCHGPILNPTGFVRRQFLVDYRIKHQREYSFYADYKFWMEVAKNGKLANIPQILVLYRTSDEQTTEKHLPKCRHIAKKIRMEMADYLCSQIDIRHHFGNRAKQTLFPMMKKMEKSGLISDGTFFRLTHELFKGLQNAKSINLIHEKTNH